MTVQGGGGEIVKKANNKVIPYLDVTTLANQIIQYSKDPDLVSGMGVKAYNTVQSYDEDIIMPRFLVFLKNEVEENSSL